MNKNDYLEALREEMNKFSIFNEHELLLQAQEVIEQFDDRDLIVQMGTPKKYLMELFEINDMKPEYKSVQENVKLKNKISSFIKFSIALISLFVVLTTSFYEFKMFFVAVLLIVLTVLFAKNKYKSFFGFGLVTIFLVNAVGSSTTYTNPIFDTYDNVIGYNYQSNVLIYCVIIYFGILLVYLMLSNVKSRHEDMISSGHLNPKTMGKTYSSNNSVLTNKLGETEYVITNSDLTEIFVYNSVGSLCLDTRSYKFINGTLTLHVDNFLGNVTIISDRDVSCQSFMTNNLGEININNSSISSDKLILLQGSNKLGNIEVK